MSSIRKVAITPRKTPVQGRGRFTVDTILEAGAHILREAGYQGFTTNRVAERAGISIGSLYQYFANKETLLAELRRRHFEDVRGEMGEAFRRAKNEPLEAATRMLVEASIRAHQIDPVLHKITDTQSPVLELSEDDNSDRSARKMIEQLLDSHRTELRSDLNIALAARISYHLVESLTHAAVIDEPELLDHPDFVNELVRALLAYVR